MFSCLPFDGSAGVRKKKTPGGSREVHCEESALAGELWTGHGASTQWRFVSFTRTLDTRRFRTQEKNAPRNKLYSAIPRGDPNRNALGVMRFELLFLRHDGFAMKRLDAALAIADLIASAQHSLG